MNDNSWEATPSFGEVCQGIWYVIRKMCWEPNPLPLDYYWTVVKQNGPGFTGIGLLILLAVFMTWARQIVTDIILKPLGRHYELTPGNQSKMPESACRFLFYTISSSWAVYLAVFKNRYFQQPSKAMSGWDINNVVPWDVTCLYALEFSYYVHSTYTLFFLDVWKKDSSMLVFHHVLTLHLVSLSYFGRYTETGCLVVLFHDSCDVPLEFFKLMVYFRNQKGKTRSLIGGLANLSFATFVITWFVSRLYYFPVKQLHSSALTIHRDFIHKMPAAYVCFGMQLFIFAMDIFWSMMILNMAFRLVTGRMQQLEDVRELEVDSDQPTTIKNGKIH